MAMENPFEGKEIWFGVGSQDLYRFKTSSTLIFQLYKVHCTIETNGQTNNYFITNL